MTSATKPIHEATLWGETLRFFRSPLGGGRPDFPWFAVDDLQRCLGMSREEREYFLPAMQKMNADFSNPLQTVATPDGPVVIAPHYIAQALIEAWQELGKESARAVMDYVRAGKPALDQLTGDLPAAAAFDWVMAAAMRWRELDATPTD